MAKKHYIIEAKGAEYISGNKITIEDCTYICLLYTSDAADE